MPSERRKEQNRHNQRRYRKCFTHALLQRMRLLTPSGMRLKNRIQMLEKVIIDSRSSSAPGENLQIRSVRSDSGSLPLDERLRPINDEVSIIHHAPDSRHQNFHAEWNIADTPSQGGSAFDQSHALDFWDTADVNCADMGDTLRGSSPQNSLVPMEAGLQDFSNSNPVTFSTDLSICSDSELTNSWNNPRYSALYLSLFPDSSAENMSNPRSREKPKGATKSCEVGLPNIYTMTYSDDLFWQEDGGCPCMKESHSEKDGRIISLRAENRRLKELSAALAHMYDMRNLPRISTGHLVDSPALLDNASMISSPEYTSSYLRKATAENNQSYDFPAAGAFSVQTHSNAEPFSPSRYSSEDTHWTGGVAYNSSSPANSPYSMRASHQSAMKHPPLTTPPNLSRAHLERTRTDLCLNRSKVGPTSYPSPTLSDLSSAFVHNSPSPFLQSLASPSSYDYHEPTLSRRLLRRCFQLGYHVLLHSTAFPPGLLTRIYDFCLDRQGMNAVLEKMRHCLGIGCGGEMVAHVDQLRTGRIPDRRDCVTSGGLGQSAEIWLEVADIECWLKGRGICTNGPEEKRGAIGSVAPTVPLAEEAEQKVPSVKAQHVSYGTVWCPAMSVANGGPDSEALLAACIQESLSVRTAASGNTDYRQLPRKRCLDIDNFFECLMQKSVCLGRTAGFKVEDVEETFEQCLQIDVDEGYQIVNDRL